ncbi:hypothetical protein HPP92_020566 [Vanilla planifolia]|uniref:Uncharacterized protein n=1 Tax=Vanilla planifolia TaxID=51239 RepID=A0A835Q0Q5_VANPL|nr:hypothetical protein HPP92_020967 [Vanilla planifolia]KAG0462090.1 hypothetical protein HPP92_020566 [Vanilla planifolia]
MKESYYCEEELWRCEKHPYLPPRGVCPVCLRERLIVLCPDCASLRPCGCLPSSSSSSSSSLSFLSSFDPPRSSVGSAFGAVGRLGSLIDGEPAFRRSRSAAFQSLLPRVDLTREDCGAERERRQRWAMFRSFSKTAVEVSCGDRERVFAGGRAGDGGGKGLRWAFPSFFKAFRHKKG